MNNNYKSSKKNIIKVGIVLLILIILGIGGFVAYNHFANKNKNKDNDYVNNSNDSGNEDLPLEKQFPYYEFEDIITYEKATTEEVFEKTEGKEYYKDFAITGNKIIHINYDASICSDIHSAGKLTCEIFKEAGEVCSECTGDTIYANYIFENEAGIRDDTVEIYVIDRQGYLYLATISSTQINIDKYSNEKVYKIGKKINGSGYLFVFEDDSILELSTSNYLELS